MGTISTHVILHDIIKVVLGLVEPFLPYFRFFKFLLVYGSFVA